MTTPVDKEGVNSCVLEHLFLCDSSGTKKIAKKTQKHTLQRDANVTFSKFRFAGSTNKQTKPNHLGLNGSGQFLRSYVISRVLTNRFVQ